MYSILRSLAIYYKEANLSHQKSLNWLRPKEDYMAEIERIGPEDTERRVDEGQAMLVCAYNDEEKFKKLHLRGAISMTQLESKLSVLPKSQEIIFYCA